ncbi:MAG: transposase [Clostridia bacterium]|nr:transposase [Clostridia bacterium]
MCVGIDVSKENQDCSILSSDRQLLLTPFSVPNNRNGFDSLFSDILSFETNPNKVNVDLEVSGHYSFNILGYQSERGSIALSLTLCTRAFTANPSP